MLCQFPFMNLFSAVVSRAQTSGSSSVSGFIHDVHHYQHANGHQIKVLLHRVGGASYLDTEVARFD